MPGVSIKKKKVDQTAKSGSKTKKNTKVSKATKNTKGVKGVKVTKSDKSIKVKSKSKSKSKKEVKVGKNKKKSKSNNLKPEIIKLADGAIVTYYKDFLSPDEADKLYKHLKSKVPWTHGIYSMFGKDIPTPRVLYAMKDEDTDIKDVYKVTDSIVWSKTMKSIKKSVEDVTYKTFRYAQLNYYRNGEDYIGFHTDSEVQTGDIIASVSLGARRKFVFRHINYRDNDIKKHEMYLDHGSLLIMNEQAAKLHWKHALPKMKKVMDGRINITFRPN